MDEWIDGSGQDDLLSRLLSLPGGTAALEKYGIRKRFPKNQELETAGKKVRYCYIIKKGRVVGYEYTHKGEERLYYYNEANSILLEGNVLFDIVCPVNFKTTVPSDMVLLDKVALMKALNENHDVVMMLLESLTLKQLSAMNIVRKANHHNVSWQICDLLLDYATRFGVPYDGKVLIQEKLSQQAMANLLGVNRVTVVRAVTSLKDLGLIEQINGYYCIRNIERLKRHQERLMD